MYLCVFGHRFRNSVVLKSYTGVKRIMTVLFVGEAKFKLSRFMEAEKTLFCETHFKALLLFKSINLHYH